MNLLYLVHRLPYPPNKGDKVRSFHLMKHLARSHRLYLGTFIDDPADAAYLDEVRGYCAEMHVARLDPRRAKLRSLRGLLDGEALSLPYYRDASLRTWVERTCAAADIDAAVVFSSVMADYLPDMASLPTLVDFVDMDSAKWRQYATTHRWPLSWLYRREGECLFAFERAVAHKAAHAFFVTPAECELFLAAAPECAGRIDAMGNGVDAEFFSPDQDFASPYRSEEIPLVFTGAMDYWPNIDAAVWFANEVLPELRRRHPALRFFIVGRSPDPAVQALSGEGIVVTGTVPDVRPYLAHATVVVAPLRIARGIQNKVLEAMAMARPVVASATCAQPIAAVPDRELLVAESAADYLARIEALLAAPAHADNIGRAARRRVLASYGWDAHLAVIDRQLDSLAP
ncbi:TIGR03087 family PEP-CTERM/XrtA system glycosyltransferase [Sulfuricystis multivorans]|uniref:TIGR03087 family PEP-CTERM/XrtA system glycosyltransferase n=1 Tax=Sulfuricystis multivorans TaxID=2211108 RepID=UPI0024DF8B1F|nr:TIGR03087 family PEP-CTERM/XrtA system glycosyltransferase [Sulfuricystis multivorans]